ncbi:MAG: transcriptional regulator NrdR [Deltaproteobacteria bacterium]|nr:transcriptional regulator NrdR [Deltaproteobacteria bacterium]
MKCPFCKSSNTKVIDSRVSKNELSIRRRRECVACKKRFTTFEIVEFELPSVVKKDGRREPFDRQKILAGLKKACEKRPIPTTTLEEIVTEIERMLMESGDKEVSSSFIGELVMQRLKNLDKIAYIRFASVYRAFGDIEDLLNEVRGMLKGKRRRSHNSE